MYEYFGVGGDMYPRFLLWLPKYRLSKPLKRSLQVWRMVIDNLAADDVSFFFWLPFIIGSLWFSNVFGSLLNVNGLKS